MVAFVFVIEEELENLSASRKKSSKDFEKNENFATEMTFLAGYRID